MTNYEIQMIRILTELKRDYSVIGVKAEFEAEGSRLTDLMRLKDIATQAGLGLVIKIGGAEALRDLYDARLIGASGIVAPMIESDYALNKYLLAIKKAYRNEEERKRLSFFINVETSLGYKNLGKMLDLSGVADLAGIVLGRSDMAGSLGLEKKDINSKKIFDIASGIVVKIKNKNLKFVVGGNIDANSLPFLSSLPAGSLSAFETRKIIFGCPGALGKCAREGIKKAIKFEMLWLKNKKQYYSEISAEDNDRMVGLESRA
jgi:hypothetical protein